MLSGLKFIPRDKIDEVTKEKLDDSAEESKKSRKKKKHRRKERSHFDSSDEDLERITKRSKKKKKWHASDDELSSSSDETDSQSDSKINKKRKADKKRSKGRYGDNSEDEERDISKKSSLLDDKDIVRKEMGLDWMLRPKDHVEKKFEDVSDLQQKETPAEEIKNANPRELNPYFKDNGSGYPDEPDGEKVGGGRLFSSSVIGDGGASWRLKALRRAKEQAARDGRDLDEVVGERWGSLGQLAVSVASRNAAPSHTHLKAIQNRKRGPVEEKQSITETQSERAIEKDVTTRHPSMKIPRRRDSLSWGKKKPNRMSNEDASLISSTVSSLNKFSNDGSFMSEVTRQRPTDSGAEHERELKDVHLESEKLGGVVVKPEMSANQIAAKVMQLRMKGKHEEADNLLETEKIKAQSSAQEGADRILLEGHTHRYITQDTTIRQKKKEDDADMHLASRIMQNKKYSVSGQADDEYDYDEGPRKKSGKRGGNEHKSDEKTNFTKRILTQQERCQFCFENPTRPRHLIMSIANFTYLMLPPWQPVVPGHCCILPMQHEASMRNVDNNVWDEIRNFKKCLIMMFAKQEKWYSLKQ